MKYQIFLLLCVVACVTALHVQSKDEELDNGLEKRKSKKYHVNKESEKRRKEEEKRRKEEEKRRKEEEERRRKEREKQEEERRKQEEHRRKEEEKRRKDEEKRRKEEEERRKKEQEHRRKEEEKRRKEDEKRRKEEAKQREEERKKQQKEREKQEKERQKEEEKRRKEEEKRRKEEEKRREEERKRRQWEIEYQKLKDEHSNDKDYWDMKKDKKEEHYPKELKEKVEKGEVIKPDEEDKFENEFGRYKSRQDTRVIDLLNAINRGHDVENLDEGDIYKAAPDFDFRDQLSHEFCKDKDNKKLTICKKKGKGRKGRSIVDDNDGAWERRKRDGRRDRVYLWINRIVPYEIDNTLETSRATIEGALQEIESKTCVKFVRRSNEKQWIKFVKKSGCWSAVGRNFWMEGSQDVSLGNGCIYKGIIMHEVMHALGFYHEQSRPDRDQYVEIFWENIVANSQHNFDKQAKNVADMLGEPYDYNSIMHYGKYSFALDAQKPTILSIRNKAQELGQREQLSETDIKQINELYSCSVQGTGWSEWSSYGPCDLTCIKKRDRFCMDPKDRTKCSNPTSTNLLTWGIDEQKTTCTQEECSAPINGHWNRWGSWGECSVTCGKGIHSRKRTCTDPAPKNGGDGCLGEGIQKQECVKRSCSAGPYDCIFDTEDEPLCQWTQDEADNADWIRNSGGTPSSSTGPSGDHTTGSGYYLFMESSSPAKTGGKTRLLSPLMSAGDRCMKFAYHMYGQQIGSLSVLVKDGNNENVAFNKNGDQLDGWKEAEFDLLSDSQYQIVIEAVRGNGFQGDIGIDDIVITEGKCGESKKNETILIPTVSKVGCYRDVGYIDGKRPFPQYKNFRSEIIWAEYMSSLNETVLKCAAHAREHGFEYFGLEFYGECWTGPTEEINFGRDGEATDCFPAPRHEIGPYLVGADYTIFVYKWINIEKKV